MLNKHASAPKGSVEPLGNVLLHTAAPLSQQQDTDTSSTLAVSQVAASPSQQQDTNSTVPVSYVASSPASEQSSTIPNVEVSLVPVYSDQTKEIKVGHLSYGLPSFHVFDNKAYGHKDVTHNVLPLGRGDTRRELKFQYRETDEINQKRVTDRLQEVERSIQGLKEGIEEIARHEREKLEREKLEGNKANPAHGDKTIKKLVQTLTARSRAAQEVVERGMAEPLIKSQMRSLALYAKLMNTSTQQALSLPYFHNKKRRDEFYFPFNVNSPTKGDIGGFMYVWADDEVLQYKDDREAESFVTAGCLFGSSLQGEDDKGNRFPLVKHDLELYTTQKVEFIVNTPTSLYEQLQFIQLELVAGIINKLSPSKKDKKLIYHLPYFDYVLFGIGLFLKNQITPDALRSLFEHIHIRRKEHTDKIKAIFAAHGITNVIVESPFSNMFSVKSETSDDFISAIYNAFPFLLEIIAVTKDGFHDDFIENVINENNELKAFYQSSLELKPQEKEEERPKAKAQAKEQAAAESKKTAKEKSKKAARKEAKATYGDAWEADWSAKLEKQWELQWAAQEKEWERQWKNEGEKSWELKWTEQLERSWEEKWEEKWKEKIREAAFVRICIEKLTTQNNHPQQKELWRHYLEKCKEIKNIEDLFEYANPIVIAQASEGLDHFKTCSILPATEKQIQVGYSLMAELFIVQHLKWHYLNV
ncbi:MAG: hypothetical protein ABSF18_05940 [Gammaproteobacteria bacterium]